MCVCEREREREREKDKERLFIRHEFTSKQNLSFGPGKTKRFELGAARQKRSKKKNVEKENTYNEKFNHWREIQSLKTFSILFFVCLILPSKLKVFGFCKSQTRGNNKFVSPFLIKAGCAGKIGLVEHPVNVVISPNEPLRAQVLFK